MADCRCVQVFMFCVFIQIFLLCVAQDTHMKNVAQNKPCGTSSLYSTSNNCSAALNGNTNTIYQENPPNCIHTAELDTSPFWWVDLGEKVIITMITIYGRTDFIERMRCVNVSVDGVVIERFTDVSGWTNDKYTIPVLRGGRVVNITKDCDSMGLTINICEVQVWECVDGYYGTDCSQTCGKCDKNYVCNKTSGWCTSCQTGFNSPLCNECANGWYGTNCSQTCGNCRSNSVCDKTTGWCTSCQTGFNIPHCKECVDGRYGADCSKICGNCIIASDCDKTTGRCTSCKTGFSLPNCTDCENGWYGNNCAEKCGHCVGGSSTCDKINGSCPSCDGAFKPPLCKDNCEKGYYGHNCGETCGHCTGGNSTCDNINGSCPSCDGAFQPPLCKDNLSSEPPMTTLSTTSSVKTTATEYPSFSSTVGMSCDNDKETVSVAGPVAGAAVGSGVFFFIIGVVVGWWLRKSRSQQPSANDSSPYEIPMMGDTGTSRSTSRPDDKVDTTHDYTNIGYTTNVYDSLKAPDDNNTTAYTSLDFHTDVHR
ncbi:multiple epidermal growth factor-like domains protein 11 isoform X3 [Pomacea canaliculata]|uniref:multiple epidermal growth factor-like domains protein 11 isoform X3 n=1 Tax=Pomacea canaliculata TaxID=400727 RepID=UPI000D72C68E|nr:multiple epidermal growth factor-like domains protein 11 isoform X3 [Pomacea canaliculata]